MFRPTNNKLSVIFLILTFLPLIIMRLFVYPVAFQSLQEEITKNLKVTVQKQTELITKWMEERTTDAYRIANNPFIIHILQSFYEKGNYGETLEYLNKLRYFDYLWQEYGYKEICVADRNGIIRIASKQTLLGTDISARESFRAAAEGALFTSSIIPSDIPIENESGIPEAGMPTLLVSAPVKNTTDSIIGAVILRVDVSEINAMMQNARIGKTGEAYLVNRHGYMLTESRFADILKEQNKIRNRCALELKVTVPGKDSFTKGVSECLSGTDGFDDKGYIDYRGVQVLGLWHWMPDYGWGVIAEVDISEGYGKLYELRDHTLFILGIVAMGVLIIAFFLGKKVSAPIWYVKEETKKIANGDYHRRINVKSVGEVGELVSAINTIADILEARERMNIQQNPAEETSHQQDKRA